LFDQDVPAREVPFRNRNEPFAFGGVGDVSHMKTRFDACLRLFGGFFSRPVIGR